MRFVHASDWHLGRLFHGLHLTDDQAHVLDQIVDLVRDARADAVVVAGDVYDRAVPPPDAVRLLDDVLHRLVADLGVPVVLIAGNHDSGERLGFGARLLADRGLHVFGPAPRGAGRVELRDEHGPVSIVAVPYAEPAEVRLALGAEDVHDHDAALAALLQGVGAPQGRSIAVAHAWVVGGEPSESERPLTVGGSGTVGADRFDSFSYAALGHLHRPQSVASPTIQYSGSLLKYSFSEAAHAKSVSLVEIDGTGAVTVERVPLSPRHDVRVLEGRLDHLLAAGGAGARDDYLLVRLTDREPLLDAVGKLRQVYPNVLQVERVALGAVGSAAAAAARHARMPQEDLFAAFFREVEGESLGPRERGVLERAVADLRRGEREAGP